MDRIFKIHVAVILIVLTSAASVFWIPTAYAQDTDLKFTNITSEQGLAQSTIHGIVKDKYGFMWFGTWGGLCRYDGYSFKTYRYNRTNNKSINSNMVHNVIKDADQNIWVLTFSGEELCRYNYEKDNFDRIPVARISKSFLKLINRRHHLRTVSYGYKNFKWVVDTTLLSLSLSRLDVQTGKIKRYQYNSANVWSLNGSNVSDIYMDNHRILWVGTYSYGINKASLNGKPFDYFYHDPFTAQSLVDNNVSAICEDNSGRLWVGTRDNGITVIDDNNYRHITKDKEKVNTIVDNQIRFIFCDSRGMIWIGTKTGLSRYDPDQRIFRQFIDLGLKDISVYAVTEDLAHNIWIGTWQGVYQYNPLTDKLKHFDPAQVLNYPWVRTIIQDRKKQLWVGTEGGGISILKPDPVRDTLIVVKHLLHQEKKNAISDNRIYCMYEDSEGFIWIGTGNGLDLYNPSNGKVFHFPLQSGLADASIAGITEDNNGFMWISHKKGISRINRKTFKIRNYTSQDGLQSNEFSEGAVFKSRFQNKLYFGGNNGLNVFNPDHIHPEKTLPVTVLTELQILNHKVDINKKVNGRVILTKPLYLTKEITLNHGDKSVAIEFAGLHYANPKGNRYAYKLEGFDKEWVYTDANRRIATYSNLRPGRYTFKVRSSNSDGIWNLKPALLSIAVNPPFWASNWAYLLYGIVFLLIFLTYHNYATRFTRLKSTLSYELLIRRKENELHQNKLQFFTNISHEIKTPLTLILAPIERLAQMCADNRFAVAQIETMKANGDRLLTLVNQLLDFRKLETGNAALHLKNGDLVDFLKQILTHFTPLLETKNLKLEFIPHTTSFYASFDEDKLEKVVANLLSNALKFTPAAGWIKVRFYYRELAAGQTAVISVANSGSFISKEELEKIFEPFQQGSDNRAGGTGLGLAFSKGLVELHGGTIYASSTQEGNGEKETTFVVELPAIRSAANSIQSAPNPTFTITAENSTIETAVPDLIRKPALGSQKMPVLLLVEDNRELRRYLADYFKRTYAILEAENGLQGYQIAALELPDLIISDVMMPEMNGFEFCKQIKTDLRTGHIPVILLTARSHEQDKIEGIETGAEDYIIKPFNLNFLAARVKNVLIERERLKEKYRQEISSLKQEGNPLSPDEKLIKKMLLYIEERLSDPELTIDEICHEIGASRANLYRKVKSQTGLSIAEVIKEVRLKRALQLLEDQKLNVNEVAYLVGFADSNHFSKCFKTEFGVSPTEFKKKGA